jgi:DNA invertase Pin-like site-specific DNA recombinase
LTDEQRVDGKRGTTILAQICGESRGARGKHRVSNWNSDKISHTAVVRAAEYVRMSTEHQKYSTENQADAIRQYAAHRGFDIIRTYADQGKSGLRLDGRDALKRLIADVESGIAEFKAILVYDVSRWGRFQDADESAYYEYICKRPGSAHYCAEQRERRQPSSVIGV